MDDCLDLPPGFRFHPTDEEIITHYLSPKIVNRNFTTRAVGDVDLNKCEPWDLPTKAKMGEKEWYFFCQRDRKYPTGMRTNRATESGYWKATGKDKEIFRGKNLVVGMKKTLVFYGGRAPKGEKTNWVMHEYRIESSSSLPAVKDEWVVCRVFHKKMPIMANIGATGMGSFGDPMGLPPLMDYSRPGSSDYYLNDDLRGAMMGMESDDFSTNYPIPLENPYSDQLAPYLPQEDRAVRRCKVEQLVSEDTENSSVVSRHDIESCYDGLNLPKSMGLDLENMWK